MMQDQVIGANAFRKKSIMDPATQPTFIDEENTVVESSKQIIDVYVNKKDFIKPNKNLLKSKDLPILVESSKATIIEFEKPTKSGFEGRKSVNCGQQKPIKVA